MSAFFLRSKPVVFLFILFFSVIPLSAESFFDNFYWSFNGNLLYFAADNGVDSDPAPILPSLGFSLAWQFWGPLRVELTEDIYFTNYSYDFSRGYPMACNPENRSAFVLGFITGIQITGVMPVNNNGTAVRIFAGPAADLRLITLAFNLHPSDFSGDENDAQLQTDAIRDYFWSKGRWFMPVAGLGMDFPINEKFMLGFDLRTWFPVYRLWTDQDLPAINNWRFGVSFRITPRKISG